MKKLLLIICIMFSITLNAQSEFFFGPVVNFNFDKCVEYMGREPDHSSNVEVSAMQVWNYNFANLGAAFNIGADIYRFTVDLSYSLGLTNVFPNGVLLDNLHHSTNKLNTFTFTVGYRFGK